MWKKVVSSVVMGILFGLMVACAVNPVSGRQEFMLVSEEEEIQLGRKSDTGVIKEYGLYEDQRVTAYVGELGLRMGKLSHRPALDWHFKVLDDPVVNAFAAPGGYIYFTRGILAALNSEAELAGVMGHEIGHVTARHSAQKLSKAQVAQVGLFGLDIGLSVLGIPGLSSLAQMGVGVLFLKFSRDDEREADSLAVEYATKAGYDASRMADFFETLQRMDSREDKSGLPSWFSTHPSPVDRESAVRSQSRQWQQKTGLKNPKVDREKYLRVIDGMIYGNDPRQGYAEGGVYYRPGQRLQFPLPKDWKVNDTPAVVQMMSPKKDAVILFSGVPGQSAADAAQKFVSKTNAKILRSESRSVHQLPSQQLLSEVRSSQGTMRVLSYFIQKEKQVFAFHGMSALRLFPPYEKTFQDTFGGFQELKDPRKINVQPNRVRIRSTGKTDTVENALKALAVPEKRLKETVILNGMTPGQTVPAATLLKVIEYGR